MSTMTRPSVPGATLALEGLAELYLSATVRGLEAVEGIYAVLSLGGFVLMTMRIAEVGGEHRAEYDFLSIPVVSCPIRIERRSRVGDVGEVYSAGPARPLFSLFATDELRVLRDGSLVGRGVLLPATLRWITRYFSYKRLRA